MSDNIRVATIADSGEKIVAEAFCKGTNADILEFATSHDAVTALENGRADYVCLNEYDAQRFIEAQRNIAFYKASGHKLESRVVFNKENKELCADFNKVISSLNKEGILSEIKNSNLKGESYKCPESTGEKGSLIMLCDPIFDNRVVYDDNGELKGTEIDIAKTVCAELGYELEIIVEDFDVMFMELGCGNADFIMSSAEFTQERAKDFIFSDVYSTFEYIIYTVKE